MIWNIRTYVYIGYMQHYPNVFPPKKTINPLYGFLTYFEVCSCFYLNFLIKFWICINCIGDTKRSSYFPWGGQGVDDVTTEILNASSREYEEGTIEENKDDEELYESNIDGILIFWLTLLFMTLEKFY